MKDKRKQNIKYMIKRCYKKQLKSPRFIQKNDLGLSFSEKLHFRSGFKVFMYSNRLDRIFRIDIDKNIFNEFFFVTFFAKIVLIY